MHTYICTYIHTTQWGINSVEMNVFKSLLTQSLTYIHACIHTTQWGIYSVEMNVFKSLNTVASVVSVGILFYYHTLLASFRRMTEHIRRGVRFDHKISLREVLCIHAIHATYMYTYVHIYIYIYYICVCVHCVHICVCICIQYESNAHKTHTYIHTSIHTYISGLLWQYIFDRGAYMRCAFTPRVKF
jgi:hypothetical protein